MGSNPGYFLKYFLHYFWGAGVLQKLVEPQEFLGFYGTRRFQFLPYQ